MKDLDRTIHEPARLRIMMVLSGVDRADFDFLLSTLDLTKGNLASHAARLERDRYVEITKSFRGKIPHTEYRLTARGRKALADYWAALDELRRTANSVRRSERGAHLARSKGTLKPRAEPAS